MHRRWPGHRGGFRAHVTRLAASAIRIFVDDLPAAIGFCAGALGLPLAVSGPGFAVFDAGTIQLVVESGTSDERGLPLVGRFTGLSLRTADMQQEYERLRSLGVRVAGPPDPQDWGGILLTLEDPAGNELRVVQYPGVA